MKTRKAIRIAHLIAGGLIGTYIYAPWSDLEWFTLLMQVAVIPGLTLSGIWMWKPQWFRFLKSTSSVPTIIAISLVSGILSIGEIQAQHVVKGGSGAMVLGIRTLSTSGYQYFAADEGGSLGNYLLQIGGEGSIMLNRFILTSGGYYSRGDQQLVGNQTYELHGGGGYLHGGYTLIRNQHVIAYPEVGIGLDAVGIHRGLTGDIGYEPDQYLEASYFVVSPMINVGGAVDWYPGNRYLKIGMRLGYQVSLNRSTTWRYEGGSLLGQDLPQQMLDGFYVRLTFGGGYFSQDK